MISASSSALSTRTCIGFSAIARSVMISATGPLKLEHYDGSFSAIARSVMISATSNEYTSQTKTGFSAIARSVMISALS